MIEHAHTLLAEAPSLTIEADLNDWAEQHHTVTFPHDEYPHVGELVAG
jgi:hypothetical protein